MAEEEFVDLRPEGEQNKKKKSGCLIFLIVMLSLLLVALIVVALGMNYIFGRLGRFENPTPGETVVMLPEEMETDPPENVEGLETMDATDVVFETVDVLQGDVVNIMLIGQDRRPGEERARSDSMILVSMNKEKGTIRLTSFMRDLYVQIPGYLDNRLNAAFRYGGTDLMNETFKVNFGLEIDGNVMVDFDEFTEIIEILGGVTLEISSAEAKYMNNASSNHFSAGSNYFNAEDALTFTRMRYAAGGDYGRTDRQRRVLMAIAESFRNADIRTLWTAIEEILPHIVTNLDNSQIIDYATTGLSILGSGAQIETLRIPQDDAHRNASIRGMAVLVPNLEMCREDLQEFIYENEN
ncbi:MAG: LytR family transcriptional regulator [Ruminococcaceae bacterium]|nr:LytR family transcriptional regulator [Oscillospiraceae bacterium]